MNKKPIENPSFIVYPCCSIRNVSVVRNCSVNYSVKDLWNPEAPVFPTLVKGKGILREQFVINAFDVTVKSHDVVAYRLTPVK